jgi:GT2 family glycosyltransferase
MKRLMIGPRQKLKLSGTHVIYLSAGDVLDENALFWLHWEMREQPDLDAIYCDEDRMDGHGRRFDPWFKPGWSPELLLSQNYVNRLCAIRVDSARRVGGADLRYGSASEFDVLLRLRAIDPKVHRLPRVLCHILDTGWRRAVDRRRRGREARILGSQLAKSEFPARVGHGLAPGTRLVRYRVSGRPIVSIIVPFRDKPELLERCVESIFHRTTYPYFEVILVSSNSEQKETARLLARLRGRRRLRIYERNVPFEYSGVNNWAARRAVGDFLLFLNNDTKVLSRDWLQAMVEYAQLPQIGAVGAKLLYPDGTIQHVGAVVGLTGMANHVFSRQKEAHCYQRQASVVRNYLAVTGACLMVQQEKFWEVGGFDEDFILCGSDVALCLELSRHGYRSVYLPHVTLIHHEKTTRGEGTVPLGDFYASFRYYEPYLRDGDPYYNPNLTLHTTDASFRLQERAFYPELLRQFGIAAHSRGG